jgi:hypothetical protein
MEKKEKEQSKVGIESHMSLQNPTISVGIPPVNGQVVLCFLPRKKRPLFLTLSGSLH